MDAPGRLSGRRGKAGENTRREKNLSRHLRIYPLTTGERVLIDESYYIGWDEVNLLITAYEEPPQRPEIVIERIESIEYRVFDERRIRPEAQIDSTSSSFPFYDRRPAVIRVSSIHSLSSRLSRALFAQVSFRFPQAASASEVAIAL